VDKGAFLVLEPAGSRGALGSGRVLGYPLGMAALGDIGRWGAIVVAVGVACSTPSNDDRSGTNPASLASVCVQRGQTHQQTISRTCATNTQACSYSFAIRRSDSAEEAREKLSLSKFTCADVSVVAEGETSWSFTLGPRQAATCTLDVAVELADDVERVDVFLEESETQTFPDAVVPGKPMLVQRMSTVRSEASCPESFAPPNVPVSFPADYPVVVHDGQCTASGGTGGSGGGTLGQLCYPPPPPGGPFSVTPVLCGGTCSVCNPLTGRCQANPAACGSGDARDCAQCVGSGNLFNCVANPARCTGNCDSCVACAGFFVCGDVPSLCTGNCSRCTGGGSSWSCTRVEAQCPGSCSTCTGSGTNFSCAPSGCEPGDCVPCGLNKTKTCTAACTWGGCISGPCQ
jgi:hypothetical protein